MLVEDMHYGRISHDELEGWASAHYKFRRIRPTNSESKFRRIRPTNSESKFRRIRPTNSESRNIAQQVAET